MSRFGLCVHKSDQKSLFVYESLIQLYTAVVATVSARFCSDSTATAVLKYDAH